MEDKLTYPHLNYPPILEAILDIQVELESEFSLSVFNELSSEMKEKYPNRKEERNISAMVSLSEDKIQSTSHSPPRLSGIIWSDAQDSRFIQFRETGLTTNLVANYTSWEDFRAFAYESWEEYAAKMGPIRISQLGLRFINKFQLPLPFEAKDYLQTHPSIHVREGYLLHADGMMKYEMASTEHPMLAMVTQGFSIGGEKHAWVTLDINTILIPETDSEDLWSDFDLLRKMKNDIFFDTLTPKALELFQ